jgi:autotransporter passenger strand-loop-strand repeat protein
LGGVVTGGTQQSVLPGGMVISTHIMAGGSQQVAGSTSGAVIASGGIQFVTSGGATLASVAQGGTEYVLRGGAATGTVLSAGGIGWVASGGKTLGAKVASGGVEFVQSGGLASATLVYGGGDLVMLEAGRIAGTRMQAGGMLDLASLAYSSGGSVSINSVTDHLTVVEGASSQNLAMLGNFNSGWFSQSSDGQGGTLVTFNPALNTTLTKTPETILGTPGNDIFSAYNGGLQSGDVIEGAGGTNKLCLLAGGGFNLAAPSVLTGIQIVQAHEGQLADGSLTATAQNVTLRAGLNVDLTVLAGKAVTGNTNPETITIHGSTDASMIVLGVGTDSVILGGDAETIKAGTGTALITGTAAMAGTLIDGNGPANTKFTITSAGDAVLNPGSRNLTVTLEYGGTLVLSAMGFVTADGSADAATIIAGASNQTLIGRGGTDLLVGYSGGGDNFLDTSADLSKVTIKNWTVGDVIHLTDMKFASVHETYSAGASSGTLTLTDGTHTAAIKIAGNYALDNFAMSAGSPGVLVTYGN